MNIALKYTLGRSQTKMSLIYKQPNKSKQFVSVRLVLPDTIAALSNANFSPNEKCYQSTASLETIINVKISYTTADLSSMI